MEGLMRLLIESNKAQQETNLALLEEQKKANVLKAQEIQLRGQDTAGGAAAAPKPVAQGTMAAELVETVEQYQVTVEMLRASRREPVSTPVSTETSRPKNPKSPKWINPTVSSTPRMFRGQPVQRREPIDREDRKCYRCGELGHISWQCEKPDEPMPTAESSSSLHAHFFTSLLGNTDAPGAQTPTCPVTVNGHDVEALLDSGSVITLVRHSLVDQSCLSHEKSLPIFCVHGDTQDYPTIELTLTTTRGTVAVQTFYKKFSPQVPPKNPGIFCQGAKSKMAAGDVLKN
ncbi:hypothetical protein SKAU_G00412920 [Synaphobranchus kaupii]|uniref:CCHC-type domain-containing protein n=1 Tax=Synaphobranchus kaupii TaxID=118154 RepID=A0A9Q1I9Y9_SYNKA|nr:hypothetical protein SKAU_G00412920 [Synaphobranchus kaupii]